MAQISLAWIMAKPGVSAPIIGTTSMSNLEDILGKSSRLPCPTHPAGPSRVDLLLQVPWM